MNWLGTGLARLPGMSILKSIILASALSLSCFAWSEASLEFRVCETALDHIRQIGFHMIDHRGREIGTFEGEITGSGAVLQNAYIFMQPSWRRRGLSRQFISRLIAQNPELKEIQAVLIYDNLEAYLQARQTGNSREESIRQTPLYKVVEPHGFTQIEFRSLVEQEHDADLLLTLRKP